MEILREQYERTSDVIESFMDEYTEYIGGENTPKNVLFKAFCKYCKEHSIPMAYTIKTFGKKIKKTYVPGKTLIDGKTTNVWQGCKLNYHSYDSSVSSLTITDCDQSTNSVVEKRKNHKNGNGTMQEKL